MWVYRYFCCCILCNSRCQYKSGYQRTFVLLFASYKPCMQMVLLSFLGILIIAFWDRFIQCLPESSLLHHKGTKNLSHIYTSVADSTSATPFSHTGQPDCLSLFLFLKYSQVIKHVKPTMRSIKVWFESANLASTAAHKLQHVIVNITINREIKSGSIPLTPGACGKGCKQSLISNHPALYNHPAQPPSWMDFAHFDWRNQEVIIKAEPPSDEQPLELSLP